VHEGGQSGGELGERSRENENQEQLRRGTTKCGGELGDREVEGE